MPRLTKIVIKGYRSINNEIEINVPSGVPLVLIGENNAGKSNIIRALNLILGEFWAGNYEPEDYEFYNRNTNRSIRIETHFDDLFYDKNAEVDKIVWEYDPASDEKIYYKAILKNNTKKYISNDLKEKYISILIGADRKLSYHLSYASKYTYLSKLMRKFHKELIGDRERVEALKSKFDKIKEIFNKVSGFSRFQKNLSKEFENMITNMTYRLGIDLSAYDPSNYFHSLKVFPTENGDVRAFDEIGTGEEQILALVFAQAYAKAFYGGIILIIEEPEAHLHPLAQEWLARNIYKMAKDGLQIVITTHSPSFINIMGLEGLALVKKISNETTVKQLNIDDFIDFCIDHGANKSKTNNKNILPFYASASTPDILSGLFAKKVVLVEGQTEQYALPIYLRKAGLDVVKEGVAVIPVMGKGNLAKWWRFFTAYGIPVYIIFDNDDEDDKNGIRRRDILNTLGEDSKKIDILLKETDWIITEKYSIFGSDFESTLYDNFILYEGCELEAKEYLSTDSKPIIGKYIAEKICSYDFDESLEKEWLKFNELKEAIEHLEPYDQYDDLPF